MFRVSVLKSAKADLKEACDFYGDIFIDLKKKFLSNFNDAINQLKKIPYFQIRYGDFRLRQVKNFPVMIHYIIIEDRKHVKVFGIRFC